MPTTEKPIDWWELDEDLSEIGDHYFAEESLVVKQLLPHSIANDDERRRILSVALELVEVARDTHHSSLSVERFLKEYRLDTTEGISIMCLAEALIRIPDYQTRRNFLKDKLRQANWQKHLGKSDSFWVNASTWGLTLSGKLLKPITKNKSSLISNLMSKMGAPLVEKAILQAMEVIGQQFVFSETISGAIENITENKSSELYSLDMLGEAALTQQDADIYFEQYAAAIEAIGKKNIVPERRPSVSIKLSALDPRYEWLQPKHLEKVYQQALKLVKLAHSFDVTIILDAEESARLECMLKLFKKIYSDPNFDHWPKFGIAVQAYQKRSYAILQWLKKLSDQYNKTIPVRLVKGAYWDSEIKWAQQEALPHYPVFTQKAHTDICYLACVRYLLSHQENFYAQFATHNAHTLASILVFAKAVPGTNYELQRLHGMGQAIYDHLQKTATSSSNAPQRSTHIQCRVYAPIGAHQELLPYLVRRLLENNASTSFVYHLNNPKVLDAELVYEPSEVFQHTQGEVNARTPIPKFLFGEYRENSVSIPIKSWQGFLQFKQALAQFSDTQWESQPSVGQMDLWREEPTKRFNPALQKRYLGETYQATSDACNQAILQVKEFQPKWSMIPASERAKLIKRTAHEIEKKRFELIYLLIHEAGKTWENAQNEVREAIDFCRYYAQQTLDHWRVPTPCNGPTGEDNQLIWEARGVFFCISPWNFPLAIFVGQIAAALVTGNTVIAKPSAATELIAFQAIKCFFQAGIPEQALVYLPLASQIAKKYVLTRPEINGIAFTGSNRVAKDISRTLAARDNAGLPHLIAETGGQNAMLVDSTALPEQVVMDVMHSAFDSAGQRCSALRVLFLQNEIADLIIEKLTGRMALLTIGNPEQFTIDVGPIIDAKALSKLHAHISHMQKIGKIIFQTDLDKSISNQGLFFPPTLIEIKSMAELYGEAFGPILHVIRYCAEEIDEVIEQINATGFGLTLGIHSRIDDRAQEIATKVRAGNVYINRNMISAQVGVNPFGGQGLSGTGPKAGGPNYLTGFSTEKTVSSNLSAIGGNMALLTNHR